MMRSGRDTLQEINRHIRQAHVELESASGRLEELNRELTSIRVDTAEHFRQLARYRLDDLKAEHLIGHLDNVDRTALGLLEKHREANASLSERIESSQERLRVLEQRRSELQDQRDTAGEALEERLEKTRSRIVETEAYRRQEDRAEQAAEVARKADRKAARAESDRSEKGRPYEADSLFMYLWNRRYLTPDYRANPIARRLDGWVAGLIDFRKNRANYHLLLEIPVRLREHAAKTGRVADLEMQALEQMEREAAEADGVPELQSELDRQEAQLRDIDEAIETEEDRCQSFTEERETLASGGDDHSKQAFELILSEFQRDELSDLYRQARATPRPEDDALVARIGQLRDRSEQVEDDIRTTTEIVAERRKALADLEALRRRFRQNSYDAYDSGFVSDFAMPVLLGKVLGGLMGSDRAWQEIGRNHRRRGGGGFGGFGGTSRGGRGGFRTGGGLGGGGFRTGGGF